MITFTTASQSITMTWNSPPSENNAWKRFLLPFVATLNVPPYSMLLWFTFYLGVVRTLSSLYIRTVCIAYWLYCILETRTPRVSQQSPFIQYWQNRLGRLWFVKWTAEYFQTRLVKTADLPPSSTYVFSYHPHGVIGMGASLALTTNGCDFDKVFPGIRRTCATLNVTFWAPIYRHWMLWLGCCSANKSTLIGRLSNNESLVLIPGGAVEALYAHPKTFVVAIQNRYGFLRLARETRAKPVPVLGFGENDIFETVHHSITMEAEGNGQTWLWKLQHRLYRYLTFSIPLWFHLFPKREIPLTVVVGGPIEFRENATIEECHTLYLNAVNDLYEKHKDRFGYKDVPLVFV